ncbi:MAG: SpoIIE family protein phosphatase [Bacteroidota bacterium]
MIKKLLNSILLLGCFLALSLHVAGQKSILAEKKWIIDHSFSPQKKINSQLSSIYSHTVAGKYDAAKKIIVEGKKSAKDKEKAAIFIYEANIMYNESQYANSIQLCDSALHIINNLADRLSLKAMNLKSKGLSAFNNYQQAKALLDTVLLISKETGDEYNYGGALFYYGVVHTDMGDNTTGIYYLQKSIQVRKNIHDDLGLASSYSFIGLSYAGIDNYTLAIDYIQKSTVIRQKAGDKRGLANSYLTMYKVYKDLGEVNKAMELELKSLNLCKELNDLQCVSGRYTNLGELYQKKGHYKEAMSYHMKALKLSKQLKIKNRIGLVHENIARVLAITGKSELALKHLDSSLQLRIEIGEMDGEASTCLAFADVYLEMNDFKQSIQYVNRAWQIIKKLNSSFMEKEVHRILSENYKRQNKDGKALYHFQRYIKLKDSLFSAEQSKELVRQELEFSFAQKEAEEQERQKIKENANKIERKRQQTIIIVILSVAVGLTFLLIFSIRQYLQKNKSKLALEKSNEQLNEKNNELEKTKAIIEYQHLEITDSIRYAQQIQQAVLPDVQEIENCFQNCFVLFKPKDVISGDFYWIHKAQNDIILVTGDCTGHGVPGGFMSMLGISLLNEIVIDQGITSPAKILKRLREKVISSLKQKGGEGEQKDGMDMTICKIELQANKMTYSTANHVVYLVREQQLQEFRGDKQPVGIYGNELLPFHDHCIDLQKGDRLYTLTDGYPDQFGGPKEKKFKYSQLKELLLSSANDSTENQGKILEKAFMNWKGTTEQTDDVTLIGIEI